ncbi:outer membrane beta-barrel protein [Novosphingobium malaysiense]|uniref:Outer membrane protein beta-barrel domain-containing protein n=1 Tax=Novosphingobium malaysiense TaxID=1348853 RepID=A0A0B1ZLP9_9SPHN|nr:outer membrane beta-barrel protein [Novosphingobium malaysiense]KHK90200.1 hypothetical protein LK12_16210 [Novosphingobium malaysiense]
MACGLPMPAFAQASRNTDAKEARPAASKEQIDAGIEFGAGYNDNIYVTRNREQDDFYFFVRPFVRAEIGSATTSLTVRGDGEIGRYADLGSENYEDWSLAADGRARLSAAFSMIGGGEWEWEHENRASPEAVAGTEPTRYQRGYGYLGLLGSSGQFSSRLAGTVTRYVFKDVPGAGQTINNDDRDRVQSEIGARGGVKLKSGAELFAQGTFNWRDYDSRFDDWGYQRNSHGYSAGIGLRGKLGEELSGEVFAGWMEQDYRDVALPGVSTWDFGVVLDWQGKHGLGGSVRIDRSVEETTLPGASAYILTSGRVSLRSDLSPRVSAGIGVSGNHYHYVGADRTEFVIGGDVWGRYWLNRHLYVGTSYMYGERNSNAAGFDYEQSRFQISIGAELSPHFAADTPRLALGGSVPAGAYAGILFGQGTLITGLDGPRGQGENTADFGDHGAAAVAVAGFGALAGSLYLGAEVEGTLGGPDWKHSGDRMFSLGKDDAFGVSARLGWATAQRNLVYGRFGMLSTRLRTAYIYEENVYSEAARHTGLSAGIGVEAPAGAAGFIRAEYITVSYDDYDVPASAGAFDNFSSSETQFRIGGGVRFGRAPSADDALPPVEFGGPYVGLEVGHGALTSSNQGTRSGGAELDVTRASRGGLIGLYAGFGAVIDRTYLGVEAEGDVSTVNWNIERDPSGRVYSADHDYSFGGSARAGALIGDAALVYGRIGVVRTRFDIRYATSSQAVRSTETRTGLRYGVGLEIGLGGRARLRADYAITEYSAYDVEYAENSDRFKHGESLFRLGLSWSL